MAGMGRKSAWAIGAAAAAFAGAALAAANSDVVKARQDSMKAQAADLKTVTDYSRGKADKDAALKAANDLIEHASKDTKLFPKGSSSADLPGKSNAKPEIWTDQARFQAILAAMHDKAVKLPGLIKTAAPADVHAAAMD